MFKYTVYGPVAPSLITQRVAHSHFHTYVSNASVNLDSLYVDFSKCLPSLFVTVELQKQSLPSQTGTSASKQLLLHEGPLLFQRDVLGGMDPACVLHHLYVSPGQCVQAQLSLSPDQIENVLVRTKSGTK